jgi:hypothetical protein
MSLARDGTLVLPKIVGKAAQDGMLTAVSGWLRGGGHIDACIEEEEDSRTLLMLMASEGHAAGLSMLLERSASLDLQDRLGRSALMHAAAQGHAACVKLLLNAMADVELCAREPLRLRAIELATVRGHNSIARMLLDAGSIMARPVVGKLEEPCDAADPAYLPPTTPAQPPTTPAQPLTQNSPLARAAASAQSSARQPNEASEAQVYCDIAAKGEHRVHSGPTRLDLPLSTKVESKFDALVWKGNARALRRANIRSFQAAEELSHRASADRFFFLYNGYVAYLVGLPGVDVDHERAMSLMGEALRSSWLTALPDNSLCALLSNVCLLVSQQRSSIKNKAPILHATPTSHLAIQFTAAFVDAIACSWRSETAAKEMFQKAAELGRGVTFPALKQYVFQCYRRVTRSEQPTAAEIANNEEVHRMSETSHFTDMSGRIMTMDSPKPTKTMEYIDTTLEMRSNMENHKSLADHEKSNVIVFSSDELIATIKDDLSLAGHLDLLRDAELMDDTVQGRTMQDFSEKVKHRIGEHQTCKFWSRLPRNCSGCDVRVPGNKLRECGGCAQVSYCSKSCQKSHWKSHKAICKFYSGVKEDLESRGVP